MELAPFVQDLTEAERHRFYAAFQTERKDTAMAVLITFFLGGFGGHWFYLGQKRRRTRHALFFWTLIPAFCALIALFRMATHVDQYNTALATTIVARLKTQRPSSARGHAAQE